MFQDRFDFIEAWRSYGDEIVSSTEQTYFWIRKNYGRGCTVWGTKGSPRPMADRIKLGQVRDKAPSGKPIPGGIRIISLDAGAFKDLYHFRLGKTIDEEGGAMAAHLHSETGEDYARQITAEEKRIVDDQEVWVQLREDNHYLDCEVLAMACVEPEWPGGGVNLVDPTGGRRPRRPRKPKPQKQGRW